MTIPSGLGATLGLVAESTVGTFVAPSRWFYFEKEGLAKAKVVAQSAGIHGGAYELGQRRVLVAEDAKGSINLELQDRGMGLLFKHMLGSAATATIVGGGPAYIQTHNPGDQTGMALSVQVGRPTTAGGIQAFSYRGGKVVDWEIAVQTGQIAKVMLNMDFWKEDTAPSYTAPSYVASNPMHFAQGSLLIGGTASTTSGVTSIAGGAAPVAAVRSVTIKGTNPLKTDRYSIGSTIKREQLANAFRKIDITADIEFANMADLYTAFAGDTPLAMELDFIGGVIGGGQNAFCKIVLPQVFIDTDGINADNPDVLVQKIAAKATDDASTTPIQIQYQSADTAI